MSFKVHKGDEGTEAPLLWEKTGKVRTVQPPEEEAQGISSCKGEVSTQMVVMGFIQQCPV